MTARCVGVLSKIAMLETMNSFLECVLPWLAAIEDCTKQEGAIEALACILLSHTHTHTVSLDSVFLTCAI